MATVAQALRLALHFAEQELGVRNIFGEDVGPPLGGAFTVTQGLAFAWNTPLDERGIVGTAAGLAMLGEVSVCEMQFGDYSLNTIDLLRLVGNTHWSTRGQFPMPMVLMMPVGSGPHGGIYHSHSLESILSHLPGWKIVMPSNAYDAYGLMISAILDGNPVAYLIPKALAYRGNSQLPGEPVNLKQRINAPVTNRKSWHPDWPDIRPFTVPIGELSRLREGRELTVVCYGRMVEVVEQALATLDPGSGGGDGKVDLLDLRTLVPYDLPGLLKSVRSTRRLLVVNEDSEQTNFGEHLLRVVQDEVSLKTARLVAARHLPGVGLSQSLEDYTLPTVDRVREVLEQILADAARGCDVAVP
jgi:2-oxoisovalerate dehydrogenase E1 component subunit beta